MNGLVLCSGDGATTCRPATSSDIAYLDHLRKQEGDALGFIPKQRYEAIIIEHSKPQENVWVTEDNGMLTGFCYASFCGELAAIWQIAVQSDARRAYRALLMIDAAESLANSKGCTGLKARVAADLESNAFWKAAGYTPARITKATAFSRGLAKSNRDLIVYVKHFNPLFGIELSQLGNGQNENIISAWA